MDEPTKQEALKKLAAFSVKIGYPDKCSIIHCCSRPRPVCFDTLRAEEFEADRDVRKIGKPVDRTDWE